MLPSSLSTRSLSCSLFWQLRISLMNTESPLIPDIAIAYYYYSVRRSLSVFFRSRNAIRLWIGSNANLKERWCSAPNCGNVKRERKRWIIQLCCSWSRARNSEREERREREGGLTRIEKALAHCWNNLLFSIFHFPFPCHLFTNSIIPVFYLFFIFCPHLRLFFFISCTLT